MAGQSERAAQLGDFSELAYINYDYYIFNSSEYENGTHTHTCLWRTWQTMLMT